MDIELISSISTKSTFTRNLIKIKKSNQNFPHPIDFSEKSRKFPEIIFLPTTHHIARTDNKLMLQNLHTEEMLNSK